MKTLLRTTDPGPDHGPGPGDAPAAAGAGRPDDAAPLADGRQQAVSALATRAASALLLCCLLLAPLGAAAGVLALLRPPPAPPAPAAAPAAPADDVAAVGQFATTVVAAWLTATQDRPDALLALVGDAPPAALSRTPFTVADPAVAGVVPADGAWSVTVAATVTDARGSTARRFFQVPVGYAGGTLTALALPAPVSPPPVRPPAGDGYPDQVDLAGPLADALAQFLTAYLAGQGEVSRYLTPGTALEPLSPPPYTAVRLTQVRAAAGGPDPAAEPRDRDRIRVLAQAAAQVGDQQTANVAYALTLTARSGRWEITAIDPVPVQRPTTPAAAPAPGSATGPPPGAADGTTPTP